MQPKLSRHELNTDLYHKDVSSKLQVNHKSKTYSRYKHDKKMEIQPQKIISSQRKTASEEERNKGTTKYPENN